MNAIQYYDIGAIKVQQRKRPLGNVQELAQSILDVGLLNPLSITADGTLIAGYHRLEACKLLEWDEVPVIVQNLDTLDAELAEIDENLIRNELSDYQQGKHLLRRNEILEAKGLRRCVGGNGANQHRSNGDIVSPLLKTTAEIANDIGLSERDAQRRMQVARNIAPDVAEIIEATPVADSITQLLDLARLEPEKQREVSQALVDGSAKDVKDAIKKQKQHERENALAQQRQQAELQAQFVHTDAVSFLARFTPRSVDMLLTDPPYSTDVEDFECFLDTWLYDALDKVKDTGRAFICAGPYPQEVNTYLTRLLAYPRLVFGNMLVWTYRNTIGPTPTHTFKNNWQAIFYLYGKDAPPLDSPSMLEQFSVIDISAPDGRQGNRYHAWQKPDELGERLIRIASQPNDFIIDPFCCTGTFGLAAANLGRRSLSGDRDADAIATCVQRGGVQVDN